ncbi:MAG: hypothetical protein A3G34_06215 [Candidatus Lindowbacteria bacterium RIFCSPLOWO2_12_FULL_62_27]|nr:MAG: hypothetical protein A3G34_06215 [Candidatus Lindowbacteria bacterium RIFCSPLOWO2_12_FULL_62_27]
MKKVLMGVSGGIAAYKIPELVRLLVKERAAVKTLMTETSTRFCTRDAIAALSGDSVYTGIFEPLFLEEGHTELARWPDIFVIAPATANTIAKLALGVADNILTTTFLASGVPKLIVPSMNTQMYDAEALQKNLNDLRARGAAVLPPDVGDLACKTYGAGRMPDPAVLLEAIFRAAGPRPLEGKRVVVSAGATVEPLDDVRVLTNRSSGKMGVAIARAAYRRGADVSLILGRSSVCPLPPVDIVHADSIDSFRRAYARLAPKSDYFVAAAAVGDFIPAKSVRGKIKRTNGRLTLEFKSSPDLLAEISRAKKQGQKILGFALESSLDEKAARRKLQEKHLDAVFLNRASAMGADLNAGIGLSAGGRRRVFKQMPKERLAAEFWTWVEALN